MRCPYCGSNDIRGVEETKIRERSFFDFISACCGYIIFGPIGILCGLCGMKTKTTVSSKHYLVCNSCNRRVN